jgi:hypothetical protein
MTYKATNTLRITTLDGKHPASKTHEDAGDGTALCGIPLRDLRGQPCKFTSYGPGDVTCARCARTR